MTPKPGKGTAIAFNYDADRRTSRHRRFRSRSPNKEAGEEKRKQQREKRKALFSAPVVPKKVESETKKSDDESEESDDDTSTKLVAKAPSDSWEKAAWDKSTFDSSADKNKFLRLMGGAKDKSSPSDQAKGGATQSPGPSSQDLERQFVQGMNKQLYSRHRGLG
eukprot:symbB.v1.2.032100.t1/scaffold3807.1/size51516/2